AQLASTAMFYDPAKAVEFTKGAELPKTMDLVRNFLFSHGILGTNATSVDVVGMSFADGSTLGDANNVKLRFDPAFMAEAATATP
ncbi:MAG: lipid kinase, partial [Mesorhizobium sp.]